MMQIEEINSRAQWLSLLCLSVARDIEDSWKEKQENRVYWNWSRLESEIIETVYDWGQKEWQQSVFSPSTNSSVLSTQGSNLLLTQHYKVGAIIDHILWRRKPRYWAVKWLAHNSIATNCLGYTVQISHHYSAVINYCVALYYFLRTLHVGSSQNHMCYSWRNEA